MHEHDLNPHPFEAGDQFQNSPNKEHQSINLDVIDPAILSAAQLLSEHGGRTLLVGGGVRDLLAGYSPKDFDLEVYGLSYEEIKIIVSVLGKVNDVGKSFGVIKVANNDGLDLDISVPRKDSKTGKSHRDFEMEFDKTMDFTEASKRRDFTMNSIMLDPLTGEVLDPHDGISDLHNKILRVTDPVLFADDPLRVMRALQFVGRFDLEVDGESFELMAGMVSNLQEFKTLKEERLHEEWKKLLLKSEKPSKGLQLGMDLGVFHVLHPEFVGLLDTPQDPGWHPEGDVWTHTLMAVDQAAKIIKKEGLDDEAAWTHMLAVLCHDLGKPISTFTDENGRIKAHGHDETGVIPAKKFLASLRVDNLTSEKVSKLVEHHMWSHNNFKGFEGVDVVKDGAFRKLSSKLHPATVSELALLAQADSFGTGHFGSLENLIHPESFEEGDWLRFRAERLGVTFSKPEDIVMGRDLIAMNFKPGKLFGRIIELCNELRNEQEYDKDTLVAIIQSHSSLEDIIADLSTR